MYMMDFFFGVAVFIAIIIATRAILRKSGFDSAMIDRKVKMAKSLSYFEMFKQF